MADALPLDLYRFIVDQHGKAPFDRESMLEGYADGGSDGEDGAMAREVEFEGLLLSGLLVQEDEDRYRIRCGPDDSLTVWREAFADYGARLKRTVGRSAGGGRDNRRPDARHVLTYKGSRYKILELDEEYTISDVLEMINDRPNSEDLAGFVLCIDATKSLLAQRIGDEIIDPVRSIDDRLPYGLEKEGSEVVGTDKETLVFRLYLGSE